MGRNVHEGGSRSLPLCTALNVRSCDMNYVDGTQIMLGDIISIDIPDGIYNAKVVLLGDTGAHLDIEQDFLSWVERESLVSDSTIVVEWVQGNPLGHSNPKLAPVGNYMFTGVDRGVNLISRGK